jgi:hypothetical protein
MYLGIDTSIRVGCGGHRMLAVRNGRREAGVVVEKGYFFPWAPRYYKVPPHDTA